MAGPFDVICYASIFCQICTSFYYKFHFYWSPPENYEEINTNTDIAIASGVKIIPERLVYVKITHLGLLLRGSIQVSIHNFELHCVYKPSHLTHRQFTKTAQQLLSYLSFVLYRIGDPRLMFSAW